MKVPAKPLLTPSEVAEIFGMSPITLSIWRCRGRGPTFIKVGRYVRYREEDINKWIASRAHVRPRKKAAA